MLLNLPVHQAVDMTSRLCFVMFGFIPCLNGSLTVINSSLCVIFGSGVLFVPSVSILEACMDFSIWQYMHDVSVHA